MIHCPNLTNDNRCQVASHLADCSVQASSSGCRACSECSNPQAVNLVTIGMAIATSYKRSVGMKTSRSMSTGTSSGEPRLPASGLEWRWTMCSRTSMSIRRPTSGIDQCS